MSGFVRWTSVAALFGSATLSGCGAVGLDFPVSHNPAEVKFDYWVPSAGGNYAGHLQNGGLVARNVRVEVWYADEAAESVQIVVPVPADIEELHGGWFTVSPQISNGESRYPRVGTGL